MEEAAYRKKIREEAVKLNEEVNYMRNAYMEAGESLAYGLFETIDMDRLYSKYNKAFHFSTKDVHDEESYQGMLQSMQGVFKDYLDGYCHLADKESIFADDLEDSLSYGDGRTMYWAIRKAVQNVAEDLKGTPAGEYAAQQLEEHFVKRENAEVEKLKDSLGREKDASVKEEYLHALHTILTETGREEEYRELFYEEMAKDRQLCERQIEKAQELIEDNATRENLFIAFPEKDEARLREQAEIIAVGERFLAEHNNAAMCHSKAVDEPLRDFFIPNPAFRAETDGIPSPEHPEARDFTPSNPATKQQYVRGLVEAVKKVVKLDPDPKDRELQNDERVRAYARNLQKRFSEDALHPDGKGASKELRAIHEAGADNTLNISNENRKTLGGKGSDEYTWMHNAYAAYLAKSRIPGSDCSTAIRDVRTYAENYLNKKDTHPFTTEGQKRVEAAAQIFTKATLHELFREGISENDKVMLLSDLKFQMLRNPTVRQLTEETLVKNADAVKADPELSKAFLFARQCDEAVVKMQLKYGVIVPGKLDVGKAEANDALQTRIMNAVADINTSPKLMCSAEEVMHRFTEDAAKFIAEQNAKAAPKAEAPKAEKVIQQGGMAKG